MDFCAKVIFEFQRQDENTLIMRLVWRVLNGGVASGKWRVDAFNPLQHLHTYFI
jgi:hypothetical protein